MGNAICGEEVAVVGQDRMHEALAAKWGRLTDAARERLRMAREKRAGFTPSQPGLVFPFHGVILGQLFEELTAQADRGRVAHMINVQFHADEVRTG